MTRVWAARGGLAEFELLEMLGSIRSPLPRAEFSPLFLAAAGSLLIRSGRLAFAHDFPRKAVADRYLRLQGKNEEAAGAQQLAESALAAVSGADGALDLNDRGALLFDGGNPRGALPFFRHAQALYTAVGNAAGVRMARNNLAKALQRSGETEPASMLAVHTESALLFREVGDAEGEGFAVNNQGVALLNLGRFHEALELFERAEELHGRAGVSDGVDMARRNKAVALDALNR